MKKRLLSSILIASTLILAGCNGGQKASERENVWAEHHDTNTPLVDSNIFYDKEPVNRTSNEEDYPKPKKADKEPVNRASNEVDYPKPKKADKSPVNRSSNEEDYPKPKKADKSPVNRASNEVDYPKPKKADKEPVNRASNEENYPKPKKDELRSEAKKTPVYTLTYVRVNGERETVRVRLDGGKRGFDAQIGTEFTIKCENGIIKANGKNTYTSRVKQGPQAINLTGKSNMVLTINGRIGRV